MDMASRITKSRRLVLAVSAMVASASGLGGCGSDGAVFPFQTSPPTSPPETFIVVEGRPLRRRGRLMVARSRCRARSVLRIAIPGIDARRRATLASHWRRLAELKHASIVAFEQLHGQLARLDAPDHLLEGCIRASRQEADHADRCFALASRYEGATVTPGRLRVRGIPVPSLVSVATDSLRDGVLNEGYAAWVADQQLLFATDPQVVATLRTIARDEAEHAQLSWSIMAWCATRGGEQVRRALLDEALVLPHLTPSPSVGDTALAAHGLSNVDMDGTGCDRLRTAVVERLIDFLPDTICKSSKFDT